MNKKIVLPIVLLALVALGLELFNIHLAGALASDSVEVKKIQEKIAVLEERNQIIETKILERASFEVVASKAAELGFVKADSYISLHDSVKFASR